MRRAKQQLSIEETEAILARSTSGVLACAGDDGYPYAVPVSYVYAEGTIYFHCAKSGHKLDALLAEPKCSFCVIDADDVLPEKFTTDFRSAIAFGRARLLVDAEKLAAIRLLAEKYSADYPEAIEEEIANGLSRTEVIAVEVEHLTGKEGIESVRARANRGDQAKAHDVS
jgi:nitroimidazol reductase NimA-like FMN-containing flavoprotein (pyridoxamine 5'-phosphate oxidase superfamily)